MLGEDMKRKGKSACCYWRSISHFSAFAHCLRPDLSRHINALAPWQPLSTTERSVLILDLTNLWLSALKGYDGFRVFSKDTFPCGQHSGCKPATLKLVNDLLHPVSTTLPRVASFVFHLKVLDLDQVRSSSKIFCPCLRFGNTQDLMLKGRQHGAGPPGLVLPYPQQAFVKCGRRVDMIELSSKTPPTAKKGPLAPFPPTAALPLYPNPDMVSHVAESTH